MQSLTKSGVALVLAIAAASSGALAADGLVEVQSPHDAKATMKKLEQAVKDKGLKVFARIDHAAGAKKIGKDLRPTELLIFGNPEGGTPLMACAQTAGIDLPLKMLVWRDEASKVWLGYNDPQFLAQRHGIADCPVVPKLQQALQDIAQTVTAR